MHAFLIIGDAPEEVDKEVTKIADKRGTIPLEFSIDKIEKTRELTGFLKLSQPPNTTVIIRDVDTATIDSLNAFLKNLEEPNANVVFLLTAKNELKVIPTIISRCQVVRVKKTGLDINKEDEKKVKEFIAASVGVKLQTIDKIKKRENAADFLKSLLIYLQQKIHETSPNLTQIAKFSKIIQKTLDAINQNGNVTMQLTNMVVKMEKESGDKASNKV
jgi:DNA polymerase III delta prime subunit